ncbi:MAG: 5'-3' exonuclease [Actinobacteria bacterium]|nr:5'-3' exonuclease [Actinomycetota bacterium]
MLLDTSSLMYRAFFSVPASVTDPSGRPVNAVHGYLDMTARLVGSRRPDDLVHVYDHDWRPAPRVAAYAGYKAARPPEPAELTGQFALLRELLDALGMAQAEAEGWEAEDAIGSLCSAGGPGERFEIVTGDRDLLQLVRDPSVRLLFTLRGVSLLAEFDEGAVEDKYGVPASRYAEFAILRGDPSDGLPGVRGVGEKTARELIRAYPSIDALVADASSDRRTGAPLKRSPALRAAIREAAPYLETMRRVVPIRTDLQVTRWRPDPEPDRLDRLAEGRGVSGPVKRLRATLRGAG